MINFPDAPSVNYVFTAVGKSWLWDGERWIVGFSESSGDEILPVNITTALPSGFEGFVSVNNTSGATLIVTLPPSPNPGQRVLVKDVAGSAAAFHIAVSGGGLNIEGQATLTITASYGWLDLFFDGVQWVQI